ncbi:MAG: hypothetical protein CHACPFDD_00831 [Phycisphaerae bacterium]|nr:hypothetical protein [Phycisphaerae bacterium]
MPACGELHLNRRLRRSSAAAAAAVCLLLCGCIPPYPFVAYPPRAAPALGECTDGYASIHVAYATDRAPAGFVSIEKYYSAERARALSGGVCAVSIPACHGRGRMEEPRWLVSHDPHDHVAIRGHRRMVSSSALIGDVARRLEPSGASDVLIFVHGYAANFDEVIRRTAVIAHDVDFDGVPIAYCWPTQGFLTSYLVDASNAEWTVPNFAAFLDELIAAVPERRVHILAHSMGARIVAAGLRELDRIRDLSGAAPIAELVFAAADIDAEIFERDHLPLLRRLARRITIYASDNDWALGGSRYLHKYARLGQLGGAAEVTGAANGDASGSAGDDGGAAEPAGAHWLAAVEVIDATRVDHGVVGHVYYGSSPSVLADLGQVLRGVPVLERDVQPANGSFRMPAWSHRRDAVP